MTSSQTAHSALDDGDRLDALAVNLLRRAFDEPEDSQRRPLMLKLAESAEGLVDPALREVAAYEIRRFCFLNSLPEVLALSGVPLVYNFAAPYERNRLAPWDRVPDRDGVTRGRRWSLMGFEIGYPVGIPASVLTANSRWIDYYAKNGFNVITYKTVRSVKRDALDFPNWVYLAGMDTPFPVEAQELPESVTGDRETFFGDPTSFSTANSFGVPSEDPVDWMRDVAETLDGLTDGKLLMVSVMGTPDEEAEEAEAFKLLAADYAKVAGLAVEAGAQAIEINLSCPNTLRPGGGVKPPVCEDPELTQRIVEAVAEEIRRRDEDTRIICKLSWMPKEQLEDLVRRFAGSVHAVSGINTMPALVLDHNGEQTFPGRGVAGVSGVAIREFGLDFVRSMDALRSEHGWELEIIGMGGIMGAPDVLAMLDAGANAVQAATAASHNPTLPSDLLRQPEGVLSPTARVVLGAMPPDDQHADLLDLATSSRMAISAVRAGLVELERHGIIKVHGDPAHRSFALQLGH